jgi:hypothetical protein
VESGIPNPESGTADAPRPPRIGFCLIQAASLSVFTGLCWAAGTYEKIFNDLEMIRLPAPTESLLFVARGVRAWPFVVPVVGLALIALALRGTLDRWLRKLIVINIVWAVLMIPFGYLSLHLPIRMIAETLLDK